MIDFYFLFVITPDIIERFFLLSKVKFIFPPYEFSIANAMITNFHTPKSTLMMMTSAFAGHEFVKRAYDEAVKEKYKFYSYGDAMLII